ncbi:MFS transporter [Saccharopolyspora mangrovi]|uniref:MFS transporter n=1 Tax=Saccharopolyspora mangrovi TaxID=3082379 RepID=A0ABU6AK36_9PSEU|nr:MFS transporter [Saccharopolyspora sp. S2-29]MEB3371903.1 MFS transporter [Saccharopolyspora sp. S2-29]
MQNRDTFRRRVAGSAIGSFVEFYSFLVYGLTAPVLARHFFPENSSIALIATFAIFAVSFGFGPLGGAFFGYLGDRIGRVRVLGATVLLAGGATLGIGVLPTYQSIGIAAPIVLLLCRVAQGFAAGGEPTGAYSYVLESAPSDQRGRWVTFTVTFAWLGPTVGSILIVCLRTIGGEQAYTDWLWRVPFIIGGIVAVIGLWIRLKLEDSDEFEQATKQEMAPNPFSRVFRENRRAFGLVLLLGITNGAAAYTINGYIATYLSELAGLSATATLVSSAVVLLLFVIMLPCFGILTDRVGRRPVLLGGGAVLLLTAYPAFLLASTGTLVGAFAAQLLLGVPIAALQAGFYLASLELFPTAARYTGHAVSFNLGNNVVGGATPLVCTVLITSLNLSTAPALFLIAVVIVGLGATSFLPETRHVELRDSIHRRSGGTRGQEAGTRA